MLLPSVKVLVHLDVLCCRNYESYSVVCRPWITIDGTTSQQLLRMFREMVLMVILDNPGIPEVSCELTLLLFYAFAQCYGVVTKFLPQSEIITKNDGNNVCLTFLMR